MAGSYFTSLMIVLAATLQYHLNERGEILINPGFEQSLGSEWSCRGCTVRLVNDSQSGDSSLLVTQRFKSEYGPMQILALDSEDSGERIYRFTGYVKILPTLPDQGPQNVHVILIYTIPDASREWAFISRNYDVESADGWVLMEAEFYTWELDETELSLAIRDPDPGVDFLVDSLSIVEVGDAVPESAVEVLKNPGFENPIGGSGWYCFPRCSGTLVSDSHTGSKAYKAFNRTEFWQGPTQVLQPSSGISTGRIYQFTGYVQVLPTLPDQGLQTVYAYLDYELQGGSWELNYIARARDIGPDDDWVLLEAEFYTLDINQRIMEFAIRDPDAGVDFLVDSLSVVDIGEALPESADQVLRNPGFENPIGGSGWYCHGRCNETRVDDSHTGSKSYKAFDRTDNNNGPAQHIQLGSRISTGNEYHFSCYVKILGSFPHQEPQLVRAGIGYPRPDNRVKRWLSIASALSVKPEDGWVFMEAEFTTPDDAVYYFLLSIVGPEAGIDLLVDTISLTESN